MDGWICVFIIVLGGLACFVACLVWHAKFGFDKEMVQDLVGGLFELVRELVGGLFGWVWEFVEELIDEFGMSVIAGAVLNFFICCLLYFGFFFSFGGSADDWGRFCAGMAAVGIVMSVISTVMLTLYALLSNYGLIAIDDSAFITVVFPPLVVSYLGFLVFGVLHVVNLFSDFF